MFGKYHSFQTSQWRLLAYYYIPNKSGVTSCTRASILNGGNTMAWVSTQQRHIVCTSAGCSSHFAEHKTEQNAPGLVIRCGRVCLSLCEVCLTLFNLASSKNTEMFRYIKKHQWLSRGNKQIDAQFKLRKEVFTTKGWDQWMPYTGFIKTIHTFKYPDVVSI